MTIGIIGAGNMGGAIAEGLAASKSLAAKDIFVSDVMQANLDRLKKLYPEMQVGQDNSQCAQADIVLVAVKPWLVETILTEIGNRLDSDKQILIVVAAGVSFNDIYSYLANAKITNDNLPCFRLIPNTAVSVQESMSLFSAKNTTEEQERMVLDLFRHLGEVIMIPEEKMSAGTALTSCGIAYALRYVRASVEAAVEMGFYPAQATEMVAQTMKGAAELLLKNASNPEVEIDKVTTPGGITIKGLNEMEAAGFTHAVIQGIKASRS